MRQHREHPRRPRREKEGCLSNEQSSRGTNQDDRPKIGKKRQRLTKQAQLSSVLWYCIIQFKAGLNQVGSFSPTIIFNQHSQVHTWEESSQGYRDTGVNSKPWLHTNMPGHPMLNTIYCCTIKVMESQKHKELTCYMKLQSKTAEPTTSGNQMYKRLQQHSPY